MANRWEQLLQEYRAKNYLVFTRKELAQVPLETLFTDASASQATQTFLRQLVDSRVTLWDAFVSSVQCVHEHLQEENIFVPLKSLIEHGC